MGEDGLVGAEKDGGSWYLPAERAEVRDVCGAGDTVLAAIGVAMSAGKRFREACRLAVSVASEQVQRLGAAQSMFED